MYETPTSDSLSYQTGTLTLDSKYSRAASVALLALGGLTLLAGTCLSGFLLTVEAAFGGESSPTGPYGLAAMTSTDWLWAAIIFLVPAAIGLAEIICGIKVRKQSTPAAVTALALVSSHEVAVVIFGINYYKSAGLTVFAPGVIAIVAFLTTLGLSATVVILLANMLRATRRSGRIIYGKS